jgi:hypothetical protein
MYHVALDIASNEYGEKGKHIQILVDPIMDRAVCRSNSFESGANWEKQRNVDMVHYDKLKWAQQIPRMMDIGIDTIGQSFEEMVSSSITMLENNKTYTNEEVYELLLKLVSDVKYQLVENTSEWFDKFKK